MNSTLEERYVTVANETVNKLVKALKEQRHTFERSLYRGEEMPSLHSVSEKEYIEAPSPSIALEYNIETNATVTELTSQFVISIVGDEGGMLLRELLIALQQVREVDIKYHYECENRQEIIGESLYKRPKCITLC